MYRFALWVFWAGWAFLPVIAAAQSGGSIPQKQGMEDPIKSGNMTYYFIEYGRGASSRAVADLNINYGDSDLTFHDVAMVPEEKTWADSNSAFFEKLFSGATIGEIFSSITEPYYTIRFHKFLAQRPNLGWGVSHTHFKVYVRDYDRSVLVTGSKDGSNIHQHERIGDYISGYSLSHGVNHITANAVYRMMFFRSPQIPDGRIQPYISLGIGFALPHVEMNYYENGYIVASAYNYQFHPLNLAFDLNIGSRFKITNHFGFYTEV